MSVIKFFEGIKFNFQNFFTFWVFNIATGMLWYIIVRGKESVHVVEVRTLCGTMIIIVLNAIYQKSKDASQKDELIKTISEASSRKDEAIKTITDVNQKLHEQNSGTGDGTQK